MLRVPWTQGHHSCICVRIFLLHTSVMQTDRWTPTDGSCTCGAWLTSQMTLPLHVTFRELNVTRQHVALSRKDEHSLWCVIRKQFVYFGTTVFELFRLTGFILISIMKCDVGDDGACVYTEPCLYRVSMAGCQKSLASFVSVNQRSGRTHDWQQRDVCEDEDVQTTERLRTAARNRKSTVFDAFISTCH